MIKPFVAFRREKLNDERSPSGDGGAAVEPEAREGADDGREEGESACSSSSGALAHASGQKSAQNFRINSLCPLYFPSYFECSRLL